MTGYYSSNLSAELNYFVGNTSYMSIQQKIVKAKDLSDYGQAKTLFDTLNSVCRQLSDDGEEVYSLGCFRTIKKAGYTENQLKAKYDDLVRLASILDSKIMDGLYDYRLVLAELPGSDGAIIPSAPNTGSTGDSELSGTIAKIAVAGVGAIAAIAGIAITTKRYAFSPLKRRK